MEIPNIYESISTLRHDYALEMSYDYVILQPHQIIPKYYMFSSNSRRTIILNYDVGTGKTLTGLFSVIDKLYISKINLFYPNLYVPKTLVIGEWITEAQFKNEMKRKMFRLIDEGLIKDLNNAKTEEERNEISERIDKYFNKIITFEGYQSFFNKLFPTYTERKSQDIDILIRDFENGNLKVSESVVGLLKNNVIVVDEMQKLYSQNGLNTYGFALSYLAKRSKELNIKIIYLSGTIFNSSIFEISSILDLVSNHKKFFNPRDLCETKKVLNDLDIYKLKAGEEERVIEILKNKYIYFSRSTKQAKPKHLQISEINSYIFHKDTEECLVIDNSKNPSYPSEIKIGNTLIDDSLIIQQVKASGFQLKKLIEINKTSRIYDDVDEAISPYDVVFPNKSEWQKYGIHRDSDGLYSGTFLHKDNLGNFSCVGKYVVELCLENSFNNEKTVLYHNKIMNFGLIQYGRILEVNGFVRRGYELQDDSICKLCRTTFSNHSKKCPKFTPIYYEFLHGKQREAERRFIEKQIYNSPNNLYGELISVLLISDVAYVGVSLLNTNNLVILTRVPNISKITQIQARIVRFKSHISLPEEKQIAKQYILGASEDVSENSLIYKYYKLRSLSDKDTKKFIKKLIPESIGYTLLHNPSSLELTKEEIYKTSKMVFDDGRRIMEVIPSLYLNSPYNYCWNLHSLTKHLRSDDISISYINLSLFPESFIEKYLLENNDLEVFYYRGFVGVDFDEGRMKAVPNMFVRNRLAHQRYLEATKIKPNIIKFDEISTDYRTTIRDYLHQLESTDGHLKKRIHYNKLLGLLSTINNFTYLVDNEYFWQYTYDICNEYYRGDEEEFVRNHAVENRNVKKVAGLYWNKRIILKNGEVQHVTYNFVNSSGQKEINKTFHVIAADGLKVIVFDSRKTLIKEGDMRDNQRGTDCLSLKSHSITQYYKIDKANKIEYCADLLLKICSDQLKNTKDKFVITPFEKDLSFKQF